MTTTESPAAVLAARIAEGLGWERRYSDDTPDHRCWYDPTFTRDSMATYGSVIYISTTPSLSLRFSYGEDNQFFVNVVSGMPTDRELHLLRTADNATEGMLTYGATNANETACLDWLRGSE